LEEAKTSQQETKVRSKLLQALTEAKQKKRLSGIHGRLGDLGTISEKYDVAVSTACRALDNIGTSLLPFSSLYHNPNFPLVIDSPEVGSQCVEFLRENNLGQATFILLSEISHLKERYPILSNH